MCLVRDRKIDLLSLCNLNKTIQQLKDDTEIYRIDEVVNHVFSGFLENMSSDANAL